jgi:hypothetical protein
VFAQPYHHSFSAGIPLLQAPLGSKANALLFFASLKTFMCVFVIKEGLAAAAAAAAAWWQMATLAHYANSCGSLIENEATAGAASGKINLPHSSAIRHPLVELR